MEKNNKSESKPITLCFILLVVILAFFVTCALFYGNFGDENTLYFFFSSIFQGTAGLLGFLGVFVVYKLQTISNENNHIFDQIMSLADKEGIDYSNLMDMQEKSIEKFFIESEKVKEKYLSNHSSFCRMYLNFRKQFLENKQRIYEVKNKMIFPVQIMVGLIGFSLISLLLTKPILSLNTLFVNIMLPIVWLFLCLIFILAAYIYNILITIVFD